MHHALWKLVWLDMVSGLRGWVRLRRSWRDAALMLLMLCFIGLAIFARVVSAGQSSDFGQAVPFWALCYLMGTLLTSSSDRGLIMRPAEIHFVAGGPFPDRDVITLSLVRLSGRSLLSAIILALLMLPYLQSYLAALLGLWLLILFSLLLGMILSLASRQAHQPIIGRLKRILSFAGMTYVCFMLIQAMRILREQGVAPTIATLAAAAIETSTGQWLLPALGWMFAPISASGELPQLLLLLPLRVGILISMIALVYLLGGNFLEASTARTDQSQERRKTALRSGTGQLTGWTRSVSLPGPIRFGGAGSVAWMQMLHSLRILPRYLVFTATIVGVVLVLPLLLDSKRLAGWSGIGWMVGLTLYADFILLLQLPVGFLGPLRQREMLKSLPITPWRIVLGQLAGPCIPMACLHLLLTLSFLYLVPTGRDQVIIVALALIPGAFVIDANVNLMGMWNWIRPRALQQRDGLAAGRAMASVWLFFALLLPALIAAIAGAIVAGSLLGPTLFAFALGASIATALASTVYVWLLTYSFMRWQPSLADNGHEETELDR
ncbi:MAG: hypothetical protein KDB03_10320 [Planctomycetales bacterium]|nr:hypothetical protein [Planctomycetales bacterium]